MIKKRKLNHNVFIDPRQMDEQLIAYSKGQNWTYISIHDEMTLKKVYDMFINKFIPNIDDNNFVLLNYVGIYYEEQKDYVNVVKYYTKAIDCGDSNAMINLGGYYSYLN